MASYLCTKCGWGRLARHGDPLHAHCGNPDCGYSVSLQDPPKKEQREKLTKTLTELCGWPRDQAQAYINGMHVVQDGPLKAARKALTLLVEAKLLKDKLESGKYTHEEGVEMSVRYKKLKDAGWAAAKAWLGWEVADLKPAPGNDGFYEDELMKDKE